MSVKEEFTRTALIYGEEAISKLIEAKVAVFGVGGVGGFVCESLARAGVGRIDIFDKDVVSLSNINRQIIALHSTVGIPKVEVMQKRIHDINPDCVVNAYNIFYLPENANEYDISKYDYIVDAVDTVSAKLEIVCRADKAGVSVISAMGAGNKTDATLFRVADINDTTVCPLARVMRRELKKREVKRLKVVFSTEVPVKCSKEDESEIKQSPGSLPFIPSVMGLIISGEVIKDIIKR